MDKDTFNKLQAAVAEGSNILSEIKPRWNSLGFPGSVYSPNEFMLCLLLAYIGRDGNGLEALREKIEAGKSARQSLVDNQVLRSHMGSDELGIIFTTALASALNGSNHSTHHEAKHEHHEISESSSVGLISPFARPQPIEACPHCGHDFEKCERGNYRAMLGRRPFAPKEEVPEEIKPAVAESDDREFCIHVDDKGKCLSCTEESKYECDGCNEEFIEAKGHKCQNSSCENIYCDDCKSELNEAGYCSDCSTFECDNCGEADVEREKMVRCANPSCQRNRELCPSCGPKFLNEAGLCPDCSGEEEYVCAECECGVTDSRGFACKGSNCGVVYCVDHKDELSEAGYCSDCRTFTCDNCAEDDVEREKMVRCASPDCQKNEDLCPDCGSKLLNEAGLCPDCSGEEKEECFECNCGITHSRALICKDENCGRAYCIDHKDELDEAGYCSDCQEKECGECSTSFPREKGTKCFGLDCESSDVYCPDCASIRLNRKGLCATCSDEEELTCSDCRGTVIESRAKKCRGRHCENVYCSNCAESNMDSRNLCSECQ